MSSVLPPLVGPEPRTDARRRLSRSDVWTAGLVLAVVLGVVARLHSPSALWLDEALSVGIARRPVPELFSALKRDGSPPLYYLLLHAWTGVFGVGPDAVRALSTVFSLAALPLVWLCGLRIGGVTTARSALLLVAVSPFAVRYATETRMYALIQLLSVAGLLLVLRALERPVLARLLPVSLVSGLLALTHYWALFLLAAAAGVLLVLAWRGPDRRAARRTIGALVGGGVLFLPWLPTFLFQVSRTGTPWAAPPRLLDAWSTLTAWGGTQASGVLLALCLVGLVLLAVAGHAVGSTVVLSRPYDRRAQLLLGASLGTLLLGLVVGKVVSAGYAVRYSSVAFVPALLLAGLGSCALPTRARRAVLAIATVAGLLGALPLLVSTKRTQAALTAGVLRNGLAPGDVVVYCPDQLGPAVSRLLPPATDQVVYPSFGSPELVDWVDYAQRNRLGNPDAFARSLLQRSSGAIWLVSASGYRTFGVQCEELADDLAVLRAPGLVLQRVNGHYEEQQSVVRFPGAATG